MNNTLYLVIPCYNEEAVLHETASQLLNITKSMIEKEMISLIRSFFRYLIFQIAHTCL